MRLLLAESKHTTSAIHSVLKAEGICATGGWEFVVGRHWDRFGTVLIERDNVQNHRVATGDSQFDYARLRDSGAFFCYPAFTREIVTACLSGLDSVMVTSQASPGIKSDAEVHSIANAPGIISTK